MIRHLATAACMVLMCTLGVVTVGAWWLPEDTSPTLTCETAWQDPEGVVANECRDAGWTVTEYVVTTPEQTLRYMDMDECAADDGPGPCYWDASVRGNGRGQSFWVDEHGWTHDVETFGTTEWEPFHDVDGHTGCLILEGPTSTVRCSDGWSETS